ncbi:MAG: hypothetical protein KAQ79_17765, partial [Cyclobacteriaceae bacterium]|nr:hypothetical protein [Cyclobacteriaceae bacterium]
MKTFTQFLIFFLLATACVENTQLNITNLKCEYKVNPLGIDIEKPRFSWNLESNQRGVNQTAYQIFVSSSLKKLKDNQGDVWDSEKVASDISIQIYYEGNPLQSNQKYFWKVKIWDQ